MGTALGTVRTWRVMPRGRPPAGTGSRGLVSCSHNHPIGSRRRVGPDGSRLCTIWLVRARTLLGVKNRQHGGGGGFGAKGAPGRELGRLAIYSPRSAGSSGQVAVGGAARVEGRRARGVDLLGGGWRRDASARGSVRNGDVLCQTPKRKFFAGGVAAVMSGSSPDRGAAGWPGCYPRIRAGRERRTATCGFV
jgi:hypothetical protein